MQCNTSFNEKRHKTKKDQTNKKTKRPLKHSECLLWKTGKKFSDTEDRNSFRNQRNALQQIDVILIIFVLTVVSFFPYYSRKAFLSLTTSLMTSLSFPSRLITSLYASLARPQKRSQLCECHFFMQIGSLTQDSFL